MVTTKTYEEWRVSGYPGHGYPPYEYIYSTKVNADSERGARLLFDLLKEHRKGIYPWIVGPNLHKRTVTESEWVEVDV